MSWLTKKFATAAICIATVSAPLTIAPNAAWADVIKTFDLAGTLQLQVQGLPTFPTSGQITIDVTTGIVVGQQNIVPAASPNLPVSFTQGYDNVAMSYFLNIFQTLSDLKLYFNRPSLLDYNGGSLASVNNPTPSGAFSTYSSVQLPQSNLVSGSLTAVSVPEPASITLLALGVFALITSIAVGQGRSRKTQLQHVRGEFIEHAFLVK